VLVGGLAAAAVFLLHPFNIGRTAATAPTSSVARSPNPGAQSAAPGAQSASPAATLPAEQQAANALAALLTQSVADRSAITSAVSDVNQCGPGLSQDAQTLHKAATSRQNLLSQLASLPDRAALPAPMLEDLTSAWQASGSADQDLAQWAQDENSGGCLPNDHGNPDFQAATAPDDQATTAKKEFVSQWNPIASGYELTGYRWNQL